jgi:flagellin
MKIQTNTAANSALRSMQANSKSTENSIQKLSSGFRINKASDDAAGLALANKLRADGKALGQAQKNAAQGSAMLQVMDGATQTIGTILDRMKELATQANSANVGNQAGKLDSEFQALVGEIGRITATTKYQGTALVDGSFGATINTNVATSTVLAGGTNVSSASISGAPVGTIAISNAVAGKIVASYTDGAGQVVSQTLNAGSNGAQTLNFDKLGVTLNLGTGYSAAGTAVSGNLVTTGTTP